MDLREIPSETRPRHPWESTRARFFLRLLSQHGLLRGAVVDIGAGDGYFARQLLDAAAPDTSVVCYDPNYTEAHLQRFGAGRVQLTAQRPSRRFDLLLALDVIEHVADDRGFLRDLVAELLVDDGAALVSVPAWMALYTEHDRRLRHHRRYQPAQLREVAGLSGLEVIASGGLFHGLLLPRGLSKLLELARGVRTTPAAVSDDAPNATDLTDWNHGPLVTTAGEWLLGIDNALSLHLARRQLEAPGLSAWVLARKTREVR